jgi:hypothetical protein
MVKRVRVYNHELRLLSPKTASAQMIFHIRDQVFRLEARYGSANLMFKPKKRTIQSVNKPKKLYPMAFSISQMKMRSPSTTERKDIRSRKRQSLSSQVLTGWEINLVLKS